VLFIFSILTKELSFVSHKLIICSLLFLPCCFWISFHFFLNQLERTNHTIGWF